MPLLVADTLPATDLTTSTTDKAVVEKRPLMSMQPRLAPAHRLKIRLSTAFRLGMANVVRALIYRTLKGAGIYRWLLPGRTPALLSLKADSTFEVANSPVPWFDRSVLLEADELLSGKATYFSVHAHKVGNPPDWFLNPFKKTRHPQPTQHWSEIS